MTGSWGRRENVGLGVDGMVPDAEAVLGSFSMLLDFSEMDVDMEVVDAEVLKFGSPSPTMALSPFLDSSSNPDGSDSLSASLFALVSS